jgi:hypothetical protein
MLHATESAEITGVVAADLERLERRATGADLR